MKRWRITPTGFGNSFWVERRPLWPIIPFWQAVKVVGSLEQARAYVAEAELDRQIASRYQPH